jgi:putative Holliday junction resolvase
MVRGRRLAFDYGDVRTGVATCDPDAIVITPLPALQTASEGFLQGIKDLLQEYEPVTIFVGEPRHLSGVESAKMESVETFVDKLSQICEIEICMVDERLSTVSAAGKLRASGKDARASKTLIDSAAAAEILEAGLNILRKAGIEKI